MTKLGFLFDRLSPSQITIGTILRLTKIKQSRPDLSIAIFCEEQVYMPISIPFPVFPLAEAFYGDYIMVSNTLSTSNKLLRFPNTPTKYFFVHNPDWIYINNKKYKELSNIYNSEELKIVIPSQDYYNIIKKAWNRTADYLIENFDIEKFLQEINL